MTNVETKIIIQFHLLLGFETVLNNNFNIVYMYIYVQIILSCQVVKNNFLARYVQASINVHTLARKANQWEYAAVRTHKKYFQKIQEFYDHTLTLSKIKGLDLNKIILKKKHYLCWQKINGICTNKDYQGQLKV